MGPQIINLQMHRKYAQCLNTNQSLNSLRGTQQLFPVTCLGIHSFHSMPMNPDAFSGKLEVHIIHASPHRPNQERICQEMGHAPTN